MKKHFLYFVVFVIAWASIWPQRAYSQRQPQTAIMHTSANPETDSLALSVLFTVLDTSGQAIPKEAIRFENAAQAYGPAIAGVEASVVEATTPIRIALVIDASGSMAQEIQNVRKAAINFIRKTPANAEIAVFRFSDELTQEQGFTKKDQIGLVENAILSITNRAAGTGNTCIYKAAYEAIKAASSGMDQNVVARPAVVLFTDGKDSEAQGQSCGEIKEEQVVTQARQSGVTPTQVHTIGLCDLNNCNNLNQAALRSLAEKTNASTVVGNLNTLDTLFGAILSALNNQWLATARVQPRQGPNKVTFTFNARVSDVDTPISFTTDFNSVREYSARPKIAIESRTFDEQQNRYLVQLNVTNPQQIKQLTVSLRDGNNNTVWEEPIQNINAMMSIPVPADQLKQRSEFFIDVKAIDINGAEVKDAEGKLPSMQGVYEPSAKRGLNFEFVLPPTFNRDQGTFEIKLGQVQSDKANIKLLYKGSITEEDSPVMEIPEGVLSGSDITVPLPPSEVREIEQAQQPKKYTIKLTLIDQVGGQIVTKDKVTTVNPRPPQGFGERLGQAISNVFVPILVILLIGAGFYMYTSSRTRKQAIVEPPVIHNPRTELTLNPADRPSRADREVLPTGIPLDPAPDQAQIWINIVATPKPDLNQSEGIKRLPCVIGRENSAFLIKGDEKVSRQHVKIDLEDNRIIIKDLESKNGTAFVRPDPTSTAGNLVETMRVPKGGSMEWDNQSFIRLGPGTVLELRVPGSGPSYPTDLYVYDDGKRTQMNG